MIEEARLLTDLFLAFDILSDAQELDESVELPTWITNVALYA